MEAQTEQTPQNIPEEMQEKVIDKRLKRLEMHEFIHLWKFKGKKKSNLNDLRNDIKNYLHVNYSYNTYIQYWSYINKLFQKVCPAFDHPRINGYQIYDFLENKRRPAHCAVSVFLHYCRIHFRKVFNEFITPKIKESKNKVPEVLTQPQIIKVIKNMPLEYQFLTEFIYTLGLRFSEALYLKVENFNWDEWTDNKNQNGFVIIKETKSTSERKIPIKPEFMKKIFLFVKERDGKVVRGSYIFDFNFKKYLRRRKFKMRKKHDGHLIPSVIKDTVDEMRTALDEKFLKDFMTKKYKHFNVHFSSVTKRLFAKKYTSHTLRKSRATFLLKNGLGVMQVKAFLGHQKLDTTLRYLGSDFEELDKGIEAIPTIEGL